MSKSVDVENIRRHVLNITEQLPYRAAGSANGREMAEYSAAQLRAAGADRTELHELPALVSFPKDADFEVISPSARSITANTLGHSAETPSGAIEGELIYVGSGSYADYEGIDLRGKIILTELSYSPARHEKQRIAAELGAAGAVMMNWGHPENEAVPFGSVKPVWGNPTHETLKTQMAQIPCIGISRKDGLILKQDCANGKVFVRFSVSVENGWRPIHVTSGEIKAPRGVESDDFVLVGGHQDSWPGPQATDNAAGSAMLLELARIFAARKSELRRGLVFGFWTAHETGTMAGSCWFAETYWDRLRENAVAYLQIDQPGCAGTTSRWISPSAAELRDFQQRIASKQLGDRMPVLWHRVAKNGDSSFFGVGIPMMHGEGAFSEKELKETAMATLGWWHHSVENTVDKLDWDWMEAHAQIYVAWLWELCTAPVLPYRFTDVANDILARLRELAAPGKQVGLDGAIKHGEGFAASARWLDDASQDLALQFQRGQGSEDRAKAINKVIKRLSRILVPLQSSAAGSYDQDMYGFTPQSTMIPCLYDLTKMEKAKGEDLWMYQTAMRRARNRVADGLADASGLIEDLKRSWLIS
jgi:hypothetical protein